MTDIETPYYCYSCGVRFTEYTYNCPECGMANCSERMSRQQYGSPGDTVYLPLES